jgi:hypothetical protein
MFLFLQFIPGKDLMLGLAFGNFWFQCFEEKNMTPYYLQHSIIN